MRSIRETARRMAGIGAVLWCGLGAGVAQASVVDCEAMRGNLTRAVEFLDPLAEDYGVFSAGSSARLKKQIGKVRDTAAASADLAALCAALQQRNEIEAYFIALDKIATLAGPAAGYMREQVRAGRWIVDNARLIGAEMTTRYAQVSYGLIEYRVYIERSRWIANSTYARNDANRMLRSAYLDDGVTQVPVATDESRLDTYEQMTQERAAELYYQDVYNQRYLRLHAADLSTDRPVFLRLKFVDGNDVVVPVSRTVPRVSRQSDTITFTVVRHADGQFALK